MKLLIIGDLHGNKPNIHFKDFDAIIAPGDFCSDKHLRPLYLKWFQYVNTNKDTEHNFDSFAKEVLKVKKTQLVKGETKSLNTGRKIMEFLNSFGKPVFIVPGNWDQSYLGKEVPDKGLGKRNVEYYLSIYKKFSSKRTNKKLTKNLKNIYDCQFKLYNFRGFNIMGYGLSNFPERPNLNRFKSKKQRSQIKKSYGNLFNILSIEYKKKNKNYPTIFLTHNVPYNTKLDLVISKGSYAHKKHYGSRITLDFCKKYHPLLCIGGHMHEHFGKQKIGKTTCINAGFGSKVNTLIDLDEKKGKIRSIKFYPKTYG